MAHKVSIRQTLILSVLKLSSCKLLVFMGMNTEILTEGRNFKTFLKGNYVIALHSCLLKNCFIWN